MGSAFPYAWWCVFVGDLEFSVTLLFASPNEFYRGTWLHSSRSSPLRPRYSSLQTTGPQESPGYATYPIIS